MTEREGGLTLFVCGDVMTGRGIDQILHHPGGHQLFEPYVQDARQYVEMAERRSGVIPRDVPDAYIWGDALEAFARMGPAARIANLETAVTSSDDHWPGKVVNYRMHPENIGCLTAARLDVCGLANNHVLDWGYAGLDETLGALAHAGLKTPGAGRTLADASAPAVVEVPALGTRILVFAAGAASAGVPPEWAATANRAGVRFLPDLSNRTADRLLEQVQAARRSRDIVVVSIHWGSNWGYGVPSDHVRFAHRLIDGGVSLVHGHSSHHPRPIEVYGNGLILYGCGDLLNDYEGIAGEEEYRGDLAVMYFASWSMPDRRLAGLDMTPLQMTKMRLRRPSAADAAWVRQTLDRICVPYGCGVESSADGTLALRWPDRPLPRRTA